MEQHDKNLKALNDASARLARGDAAAVEPLIAAYVLIGFGEPEARRFCEATARLALGGDTSAALEDEIAAAEHAMILTVEDPGARFELLAEALPRGVAVRRESRQLRRQLATKARALGCENPSDLAGFLERRKGERTRSLRFLELAREARDAIEAGRDRTNLWLLLEGALLAIPEKSRDLEAELFAMLVRFDVQARAGEAAKRLADVYPRGRSLAAKRLGSFLVVAGRLVWAVAEGRPSAGELREVLADAFAVIPEGPQRATASAVLEDVTRSTTPIGRT